MQKKAPIILLSVLCAIGVHVLLFTNGGHRLQSSILESDTTSHAEAHLVASEKILDFKVNVTATNITKITGILTYDDESLVLTEPRSPLGTINVEDADSSKQITLTFPQPISIRKGDTLISWTLTPVLPETHAINLNNVTIFMTDGDESLTTEGTGEF